MSFSFLLNSSLCSIGLPSIPGLGLASIRLQSMTYHCLLSPPVINIDKSKTPVHVPMAEIVLWLSLEQLRAGTTGQPQTDCRTAWGKPTGLPSKHLWFSDLFSAVVRFWYSCLGNYFFGEGHSLIFLIVYNTGSLLPHSVWSTAFACDLKDSSWPLSAHENHLGKMATEQDGV